MRTAHVYRITFMDPGHYYSGSRLCPKGVSIQEDSKIAVEENISKRKFDKDRYEIITEPTIWIKRKWDRNGRKPSYPDLEIINTISVPGFNSLKKLEDFMERETGEPVGNLRKYLKGYANHVKGWTIIPGGDNG